MKAVILAGGLGTRMGEQMVPKPLVTIGGIPIIQHIMQHYANHGITDFVICAGYKGEMIETWAHHTGLHRWNIEVVDTGVDTLTAGRLLKVRHLLDEKAFCMTYGDAISDVNIEKLIGFHQANGNISTVTAVRFLGRFGHLHIESSRVTRFEEKPNDWINGGFFVLEPHALDFIGGDCAWESLPMQSLVEARCLSAYQHEGMWQCMDTERERQLLEEMWNGHDFLGR